MEHLLQTIIVLPFMGALVIQSGLVKNVKETALGVQLLVFLEQLTLWVQFDNSTAKFQFVEVYNWLPSQNIYFSLGVDGIQLFFMLLTTLLVPLCLLGQWELNASNQKLCGDKEYLSAFLVLEGFILIVFSQLDLLVFYIFFEQVLIPMFLIIGVWGSRERKIRAAYFFFLYTLLGSVFMLLAVLLIYFEVGQTDYLLLVENNFSVSRQKILWLAFFASFAVKVPMVPVHIWLPEAHVEAPTAGQVILAGILLKLGTYGFIRFSLPLFPAATVYFTPLIYAMSIVAIIYTSLTAIRQSDMKRVIAYASVAHMNITLVGLFSLTLQGVEGSILQMLSHGLVSGALFLCVGVLYDRHHSRMIKYYSGVTHTMPLFVTIFLFFTLANIALPGTQSFVGEFLILLGIFQVNTFTAVMSATGMVLGGAYSLWLFNRIAFGNLKQQFISFSTDINRREAYTFFPLVILTLIMGIYPQLFLEPMHVSCANLIEHVIIGSQALLLYFL